VDFEYLKYMSSESSESDKKDILHDLMTAYGDDVWNYAFLLCKNPDLADDITQDTFLKAFNKLFSFRGQSTIKTWLFAIARNTTYDYKKSSFFRRVTLVEYISPQYKTSPSAEMEAMEVLVTSELWKQVLVLPVKLREAIILYAHHQLKIVEISDLLGISEGTVKSRIFKARLKLLQLSEEHETFG
jgi:RNA polymerase sigma-70 factor (ECF subfamily)